ncbi:TAF5-like RNA polymerase II [Orbilia blumenaviensis]|uniref:TAF5-like RNA polymerase II n=1 Tax=Orbilia blumenaviensis TaxID=1796055 RepID=A0AAV9UN66_9PEZI
MSIICNIKMAPPIPPDPIIILLIGITGIGKSTFIKQVTGLDVPIGDDLESLTASVTTYKTRISGKEVWFMDTPGFNDTNQAQRSDTEVLGAVSTELVKQHREGLLVNGVVYLHKITEDRMYGTHVSNLLMLRRLVGEPSLRNVVLATTKWDAVTQEEGEKRERQLKQRYWARLIEHGAKVARIRKEIPQSYLGVVDSLMENMGITLQIQKELGDDGLTLEQSSAGKVVLDEVNKATAAFKRQMERLSEELKITTEQGQQNMKSLQDLMTREKNDLEAKLQQAARDREILQKGIQELQRELASHNAHTPAPPSPPPSSSFPPPPPQQLQQSENYNVLDSKGEFPLYRAAAGGHYSTVKRMLEGGANPSMRTKYQWTALHWAVGNGHTDVVQLLLAYGAEVNAVSDTRRRPLSMAGTERMRHLLRQRGAS